ncbi:cyclic nucleotide-binding domain-containing protein [Lujinxingia litoralis]|nr:cyclic nucleotide-binding domain-containing protein [Lujinxingia litoralis]
MERPRAEDISWLGKAAVFGRLSEQERRMLASVFRVRDLKAGEVVCKQGDAGDSLAVVTRGELSVRIRSGAGATEVRRLGRFDVFGDMSMLDPAPRSATVVAEGEARIYVLERPMVQSLQANAPVLFSGLVRGVADRVAERLERTNDQIEALLVRKRAPTQPRQPSLKELCSGATRGRPHRGPVALLASGALASFSARELEVFQSATVARRFAPGETICVQDEPARAAFVVVEGWVDVLRAVGERVYRLARVGAGSVLGQLALLRDTRRRATLRAVDEVVLLGLARDRFDALLAAPSSLAIGFQTSVTLSGIRQLRMANQMVGYLEGREEKRVIPDLACWRVREVVGEGMDGGDDVEAIAAAYLQTSLQNWDMSPSELQRVRVVKAEGVMTPAELRARLKT